MVDASGMFTLVETLAIGLYFVKIGYYFLLFGYFLIIRFRRSKRIYWLYFSLFFIFLAISRVGYLFYDYFLLPTDNEGLLAAWKFANINAWIAVSCLSGILSVLLFTGETKIHKGLKTIFPLVPLGIAIHIIFLPLDWIVGPGIPMAKLYMNYIILPLYIVLLPFMFFYLAKRSAGTLQRSFFLNGLGLLIYYVIRAMQGGLVFKTLFGNGFTANLMPPLIMLLAILIIAFANQYEHLK